MKEKTKQNRSTSKFAKISLRTWKVIQNMQLKVNFCINHTYHRIDGKVLQACVTYLWCQIITKNHLGNLLKWQIEIYALKLTWVGWQRALWFPYIITDPYSPSWFSWYESETPQGFTLKSLWHGCYHFLLASSAPRKEITHDYILPQCRRLVCGTKVNKG